jgi:hypothetical protein
MGVEYVGVIDENTHPPAPSAIGRKAFVSDNEKGRVQMEPGHARIRPAGWSTLIDIQWHARNRKRCLMHIRHTPFSVARPRGIVLRAL